MSRFDVKHRPSAACVTQHPALSPVSHKSSNQLRRELCDEKLKNDMLTREVDETRRALLELQRQMMSTCPPVPGHRSQRLVGRSCGRSRSLIAFWCHRRSMHQSVLLSKSYTVLLQFQNFLSSTVLTCRPFCSTTDTDKRRQSCLVRVEHEFHLDIHRSVFCSIRDFTVWNIPPPSKVVLHVKTRKNHKIFSQLSATLIVQLKMCWIVPHPVVTAARV